MSSMDEDLPQNLFFAKDQTSLPKTRDCKKKPDFNLTMSVVIVGMKREIISQKKLLLTGDQYDSIHLLTTLEHVNWDFLTRKYVQRYSQKIPL